MKKRLIILGAFTAVAGGVMMGSAVGDDVQYAMDKSKREAAEAKLKPAPYKNLGTRKP